MSEYDPTPRWIMEAKYGAVLQVVLDAHGWEDKYPLLETIIAGLIQESHSTTSNKRNITHNQNV